MRYVLRIAALSLGLMALSPSSVRACGSFVDPKGRSRIDFAPLPGFVDNCWQSPVCEMFVESSSNYPVALFLDPNHKDESFSRQTVSNKQLSAQVLNQHAADNFDELRLYIKQSIPNLGSEPPITEGRVVKKKIPFGVFNESADSISWGFAERSISLTDSSEILDVSTVVGTHMKIQGMVVSLYVIEGWGSISTKGSEPDGESTKLLAKRWIDCIREKNKR